MHSAGARYTAAVGLRAGGPGRLDQTGMPRTPRISWLFAALACLPVLYCCSAYFSRSGKGIDFPEFYSAARLVGEGFGHRLYDASLQWQFQARLTGRVGTLFNHPPFETLLYLPFSWFPYRLAYLLWSAFNLLLLGLAAWRLRGHLSAPLNIPTLFLLFLAFPPVTLSLLQGQDSILLLLAFTTLTRMPGHEREAGLWLGLGLIKFQFVIPAALILGARRSRPFAAGLAAAGSALLLISVAISGPAVLLAYPRFLHSLNGVSLSGIHPYAMPNLRGLCALAFSGSPRAEPAALLALSVMVFVLAWNGWRQAAAQRGRTALAVSNTVLAAVLLSYHASPHDLTLLIMPLAITFAYLRTMGARSSRLRVALLVTALALALPPAHVFALRAHWYSLLALAVLVLFMMTHLEISRPRDAVQTE